MASENERLWLEEYIRTGDAKQATRKVFNSSEKNLAARSAALKSKLAFEIDKRLREEMRTDSVALYANLRKLAQSAQSEQVQAKATMDLLDRGGYKPVDQTEDITPEVNRQDLQEQLEDYKRELINSMTPDEIARLRDQ